MAERRKFDDRQPAMPKRDSRRGVDPYAGIVGPAMCNRIAHAAHALDRLILIETTNIEKPGDAAHHLSLRARSSRSLAVVSSMVETRRYRKARFMTNPIFNGDTVTEVISKYSYFIDHNRCQKPAISSG